MTSSLIAPFVAHRIATLPGDVLHLDQELTEEMLEDACQLMRRADSLSEEIADAIHVLVPTCSEDDRRALLALRRDLHNHRHPKAAGQEAAERLGLQLDELIRRRAAVAEAKKIIVDTTTRDSSAAEARIRDLLEATEVADALRLLSPGFSAAVGKPAPAGSKRGRSALAYAARTTMKPSPLSTLTRTAVDGADLTGRVSALSPMVSVCVVQALASRRRALPDLQYRSTVRSVGGQHVASAETAAMVHGTVVFGRDPKRLHSDDHEAALLSTWTAGDENDLLRRAGDGGWQRAERWIASGVVRAVLPWSHEDRPPEVVLSELMLRSESAEIVEAGRLLAEIGRDAGAVATTSGSARSQLIASIQHALQRLATAVGTEFPAGRLVNEDAGALPPKAPSTTAALASSLTKLIRPTLFRSRVYDVLIEAFLAEHGPGGTAPNVMDFLTTCALSRPFHAALQAARAADRAPDAYRERTDLLVGATSAPPTSSVFVQDTQDTQDTQVTQDPSGAHAVVNQVMPGLGGVVGRFSALGDAPSTLVPMINDWVSQLYPGAAEIRSVLPGQDSNPLQRAAAPVLPPLRGADLDEAFAGIALTHDSARNVFEFVRRDRSPVAPVSLGIVPAWTFDGPVGLLLAILDPWIDGSQLTRESNPIRRAYRSEGAERYPRRTELGVVTRRETWRIPTRELPTQGDLEPGGFLMALHEWRTAFEIPDEVFVRVHGDDPFDSATRKPMWMRFSSWYSVSAIWALLPGRHTIEIQESLPARPTAGHVQETVVTLGWPRPGAEANQAEAGRPLELTVIP